MSIFALAKMATFSLKMTTQLLKVLINKENQNSYLTTFLTTLLKIQFFKWRHTFFNFKKIMDLQMVVETNFHSLN